jgi:hypothetical protein
VEVDHLGKEEKIDPIRLEKEEEGNLVGWWTSRISSKDRSLTGGL